MNYRSPVLSLQHELETLEAELAALRAMPPAKPRPAPGLSRKVRAKAKRETRALHETLRKVRTKIKERETLAARERRSWPVALGFAAVGTAILCGHLAIAVETPLVWIETTCTIEKAKGVFTASYRAGSGTRTFLAAGATHVGKVPCWVPASPTARDVGWLERPARLAVPLQDKLSPTAILLALLCGLIALAFLRHDASKRRES